MATPSVLGLVLPVGAVVTFSHLVAGLTIALRTKLHEKELLGH